MSPTLHGKTHHRQAVGNDVVACILEERASNGKPARYFNEEEQERRLVATYKRGDGVANVWSAESPKVRIIKLTDKARLFTRMLVHQNQLKHVQKGCLERIIQDIKTDESRIEVSHKGWNRIMLTFPCGLVLFCCLGQDHVCRYNVRIAYRNFSAEDRPFVHQNHGSHHVDLCNYVAKTWNEVIARVQNGKFSRSQQKLRPMEVLIFIDSGERFGVVDALSPDIFSDLVKLEDDEFRNEVFFKIEEDPTDHIPGSPTASTVAPPIETSVPSSAGNEVPKSDAELSVTR